MTNPTDIQAFIQTSHDNGDSKDTIGTALIRDHGYTPNSAHKALKLSGVKFGRVASEGWRQVIVACFTANPAATLEDLTSALSESQSVKDPAKYAAYYYDMATELIALTEA